METEERQETDGQAQRFTCVTCAVTFDDALLQRQHFKDEFHRYNMKRRVATLPPISHAAFQAKLAAIDSPAPVKAEVEREAQTKPSHLSAKKAARKAAQKAARKAQATDEPGQSQARSVEANDPSMAVDGEEDDEEILVQRRLDSTTRQSPMCCLFQASCPEAASIELNLDHMRAAHSFRLPEPDYIVDAEGLIRYLADKITIGFTCLACPRSFTSAEATRKHMLDKGHARLGYDSDAQQLEVGDYYDFTSTYASHSASHHAHKHADGDDDDDEEGWETEEEDTDEDEEQRFVEQHRSGLQYGDSEFELVLPNGQRIGHRSLKTYYRQAPLPEHLFGTDDASRRRSNNAALRLADKQQSGLILVRGQGSASAGLEVQKARNAGEASWARSKTIMHKERQAVERQRTRVAFTGNNQKHFVRLFLLLSSFFERLLIVA